MTIKHLSEENLARNDTNREKIKGLISEILGGEDLVGLSADRQSALEGVVYDIYYDIAMFGDLLHHSPLETFPHIYPVCECSACQDVEDEAE